MAFPTTPLGVTVELQLNSVWTDVSSYVYERDSIVITRGRQNEGAGNADPGTCSLTLNNRDGRFSPRNPTGPYYGLIGRNTPIRVSAQVGATRLTGFASSSTPDSAGLSITGDLDIRVDLSVPSWATVRDLIAKDSVSHSYLLRVSSSSLVFLWSPDGVTQLSATSTVPLPTTTGRQAVRATIDVDNGASGRTITFYYAPTIAGPWTQLGSPVVQAGVTSIFDSTDVFKVLNYSDSQTFAAELRQGIGGTVRANPDWTAQAEGATSFVDGVGNTWTASAGSVTSRRYRFYGEVSSWPQAWDVSGKDVWVPLEAAGITRRLGQSDPLLGPIQRGVIRNASTTFAYWPMEDDSSATTIASGLPGGSPMTFSGAPQLSSNEDLFPAASGALPVLAGAAFYGSVTPYTASGFIHARCLLGIPATGETLNGIILRLYTTGTAAVWDLAYSGGLTLNAYSTNGVLLFTQPVGFTVTGQRLIAGIELTQNGANVDWHMFTADYYNTVGFGFSGTLASNTCGAATNVQINVNTLLTSTVIGHVAVQSIIPDSNSFINPMRGWAGETAGRRVERLCSEEGVSFQAYGDLDQTVAMGVQPPGTLPDLLSQCEATDLGQVFESREALALCYRTRDSRQYQNAALALAYGNLAELAPTEDDQATRNDFTVTRIGGSSARVTIDTGTLSTQAPPNGVGRYAETESLSLYLDSQCSDHASLRAAIGTVDEPRYPAIQVHLEAPAFAASSALTAAALDAGPGDLITVTGTPVWLPPDGIRQHSIGQTETLGPFEYEVDFVCVSATPVGSSALYDVTGRYAGSGSTLTANITSAATGAAALSITTPAGSPLWTTSAGDFPLDILVGGERITLSAISGTSSPQSATVSARSVNGVVKAQTAGAAIDIADPVYYAL